MGIGGAAANLKQRHHTAKTHMAAVGAAWGAFKAARNMDMEEMAHLQEVSTTQRERHCHHTATHSVCLSLSASLSA